MTDTRTTEQRRLDTIALANKLLAELGASDEPAQCEVQVYAETYDPPQPAELCENEAVEGSDRCLAHGGGQ